MMGVSGKLSGVGAAVLALGLMGAMIGCTERRGGYYEDPYGRGPIQQPRGQWAFLGANEVSFRTENDVVQCNPNATWQRLQLTARDGAVELNNVRVFFLNRAAPPYDAPVQRYVLSPENPSVIIELPGEVRRNITQISFTYRNVDPRRYQRAKLEVWGQ